ncbi:type II toxin-antitoxin system RelE/ParE family toxin [bacterium]|nr:type II toxin-antitoxin system RelE/ParE family toxin [bacterium]
MKGIWRYTLQTWGERQARTYILELNAAFKRLAAEPGIGQPCEYIREGYRKHPVRKHVVFYRRNAAGIEIVRVLHARMDVDRAFGGD